MARVTVEDCIINIPNRFELVELAAQRAKQIASGAALTVSRDNDKDAVVSLREIADQTIDLGTLKEEMILQKQRYQPADTHTEDEMVAHGQEASPAQINASGVDEADLQDAYAEDTAHAPGRESEEALDDSQPSFSDENVDVED